MGHHNVEFSRLSDMHCQYYSTFRYFYYWRIMNIFHKSWDVFLIQRRLKLNIFLIIRHQKQLQPRMWNMKSISNWRFFLWFHLTAKIRHSGLFIKEIISFVNIVSFLQRHSSTDAIIAIFHFLVCLWFCLPVILQCDKIRKLVTPIL